MTDRERMASEYALRFVADELALFDYSDGPLAQHIREGLETTGKKHVRLHYLAGAESEAAHWEARVKGLVEALEQYTHDSHDPGAKVARDALAAFRASDTSSVGGGK